MEARVGLEEADFECKNSLILHGDWSWSWGKSAFIRGCPTVATPEGEARAAEELRELARLEKGSSKGARAQRS